MHSKALGGTNYDEWYFAIYLEIVEMWNAVCDIYISRIVIHVSISLEVGMSWCTVDIHCIL